MSVYFDGKPLQNAVQAGHTYCNAYLGEKMYPFYTSLEFGISEDKSFPKTFVPLAAHNHFSFSTELAAGFRSLEKKIVSFATPDYPSDADRIAIQNGAVIKQDDNDIWPDSFVLTFDDGTVQTVKINNRSYGGGVINLDIDLVLDGINLIVQQDLKSGYLDRDYGNSVPSTGSDFYSDNYIATDGATVFTLSSPDYAFKGSVNHTLGMYDSDKNYLGYQTITSATQTLSKSNVAYIRFSMNFVNEGGVYGKLSDWLDHHRYKLEKWS